MLGHLFNFAWYGSTIVELFFVANLARLKLAKRYLPFLAWAAVDAAGSLILMRYTQDATVYFRLYLGAQILLTICQFLAIRSIFAAHVADYPGIGDFGQKLLGVLLATSIVVSVIVVHSDWRIAGDSISRTLTALRIVTSAFAVFLAGGMAFFARYRVPTNCNVLVFERGAAVSLTVQAATFLAMVMARGTADELGSLLVEVTTFATFAYWVIAVRRSAEVEAPQIAYDPAEHARTERLNQEMLRLAGELRTVARRSWR